MHKVSSSYWKASNEFSRLRKTLQHGRCCFEEREYINNKIQQITLPRENEWHIGLIKDGQEKWKWVNGKPLTIDKWQREVGQPSREGNVAVMAKNYPRGSQGLFNDLEPHIRKPYICEIPKSKWLKSHRE